MKNQKKTYTKKIYFDHNATSPMSSKVKNSLFDIYSLALNPSSLHSHGRYARKILEESRETIKNTLQLNNSHELIFTSGCTEANNIILNNFDGFKKICSCIEHQSVLNVIGEGIIPVNSNGVIDIQFIEKYLIRNNKKLLLSIMYANNQIGTIQPIQQIIRLAKKYNFLLHCDITQALGRIKIYLNDIDLITFSSHKFGGPIGSGALVYRKNLTLLPMFKGGGQEFRLRSGTENVAAIHGMSTAFKDLDQIIEGFKKTKILKTYLEKEINGITDKVVIFGNKVDRLPNTSSISMPKVTADMQMIYFDLNGVSISTGSACSSGMIDGPKIQLLMGYDRKIANNSLRISFGPSNTIDDVQYFLHLWKNLYLQHTSEIC